MTSKLDTAGLVERLRAKRMRVHDLSGAGWEDDPDCIAAADLIEALKRERDELLYLQSEVEAGDRIMQQRVEAAEARVAELEASEKADFVEWLRAWAKDRFGKWITHNTASGAWTAYQKHRSARTALHQQGGGKDA